MMRWPFVLRATHDGMLANARIACQNATNFQEYAHEQYTRELASAHARYDEAMAWNRALVQQIVELRRDGFAPPVTYPTPDAPASLPAKVEAALKKAEAGLPRDVKVAMREKASALLAAEKTPDDVVEIITRGLQVVA